MIVCDRQLYEPVVDMGDWAVVQDKLRTREKPSRQAPKKPGLYLSTILFCGGCGKPMQGADRPNGVLLCNLGTTSVPRKDLANSSCMPQRSQAGSGWRNV